MRLSSATRSTTVDSPFVPSKLFSPHRLTFRCLTRRWMPMSRNEHSELPSRFSETKGRNTFSSWMHIMLEDIWIFISSIVRRSLEPAALYCLGKPKINVHESTVRKQHISRSIHTRTSSNSGSLAVRVSGSSSGKSIYCLKLCSDELLLDDRLLIDAFERTNSSEYDDEELCTRSSCGWMSSWGIISRKCYGPHTNEFAMHSHGRRIEILWQVETQ